MAKGASIRPLTPAVLHILLALSAQERHGYGIMKQVEADPWDSIEERFRPGVKVQGKVRNLTDFGAFVELEPGIDGLLHISQMSSRPVTRPEDVVQMGDELTVKVIRVEPNERRIGLSLRDLAADLPAVVVEEQEHHGRRGGRRRDRDRYEDEEE